LLNKNNIKQFFNYTSGNSDINRENNNCSLSLRSLWGLWCSMPLSTIFQFYRGGSVLLVEETRVPKENHRPVTSHWQTL